MAVTQISNRLSFSGFLISRGLGARFVFFLALIKIHCTASLRVFRYLTRPSEGFYPMPFRVLIFCAQRVFPDFKSGPWRLFVPPNFGLNLELVSQYYWKTRVALSSRSPPRARQDETIVEEEAMNLLLNVRPDVRQIG